MHSFQRFARQLAERLMQCNLATQTINMADYDPEDQLVDEVVIILKSTTYASYSVESISNE